MIKYSRLILIYHEMMHIKSYLNLKYCYKTQVCTGAHSAVMYLVSRETQFQHLR